MLPITLGSGRVLHVTSLPSNPTFFSAATGVFLTTGEVTPATLVQDGQTGSHLCADVLGRLPLCLADGCCARS